MLDNLIERYVLSKFSLLPKQLKTAKLSITPLNFIKRALFTSFFVSTSILIISLILSINNALPVFVPFILFILSFILMFFYIMFYPYVKVIQRRWEIDREVVFAARHILISLRSGMPLYNAFLGAATGYGEVSKEIEEIMRRTTGGMPLTHAIREVANETPSKNLRRILLQVTNALSSGSDVADNLEAITEQISSEQLTSLKAYGQKLNPFIMFYLMFSVVFPSIGMAFMIILLSLIGGTYSVITNYLLVIIAVLIALLQYLFVSAIENSRPKYMV